MTLLKYFNKSYSSGATYLIYLVYMTQKEENRDIFPTKHLKLLCLLMILPIA